MGIHRRTVLSALGVLFPAAFVERVLASDGGSDAPPVLRFRSFEDALRSALPGADRSAAGGPTVARGVEVGHSDLVARGLQGCHNERPFAGCPAGHLRIVRAGSGPGPVVGGVRLYVHTVDVAFASGHAVGADSRPLDFALIPPAPVLAESGPHTDAESASRPGARTPVSRIRTRGGSTDAM